MTEGAKRRQRWIMNGTRRRMRVCFSNTMIGACCTSIHFFLSYDAASSISIFFSHLWSQMQYCSQELPTKSRASCYSSTLQQPLVTSALQTPHEQTQPSTSNHTLAPPLLPQSHSRLHRAISTKHNAPCPAYHKASSTPTSIRRKHAALQTGPY